LELAAFHPARIALAVLAGLALLTLIFSARIPGGARRAGEIYRRHFAKPHRERQLVTAIAFYVTFAVVRILTHAIRAGRGPFHNLEVGGRHIHHLVWGILLLLIVGYGWLLQFGTDMQGKSRWAGRLTAFLFGVGAALPLVAVIVAPQHLLIAIVAGASLLFLAQLGAWAAAAGGASMIKGAARVTFWGALAMAVTAGAGMLFGATP